MVFLEFEKPLETLYEQLDKIKEIGQGGDIDVDICRKYNLTEDNRKLLVTYAEKLSK